MTTLNWWEGATPHQDIRDGRVNEALFAASLGRAIRNEGAPEYCETELFFRKTYLTRGLRELLIDVLHTLDGQPGQNPVANLQTSFGGGKTHTELAIYHLLKHPAQAMQVAQAESLLAEAGLERVPPCQVAVLPCASLNPLGRPTEDGVEIRTLWGEMAYQLGGKPAFDLVADNDAQLISPGEATLGKLLETVGPCVVLFDETLHYVDKSSELQGDKGSLAKQTVAFLRELTIAVDMVPKTMLVVSLTASRMDQLSPQAQEWLTRMDHHVRRVASARTPIEGTEIHEIVRQRLFESVDEGAARETAKRYHELYTTLGGLPAHIQSAEYRKLLERSYPFHPELVTILYERWGSKPGFQLTRGTLRFLALALQDLWARRQDVALDLIQPPDISLAESNIRSVIRDVAGDAQWEAVLGSDVASTRDGQPAKAQLVDRERDDGLRLAEGLAGTILMYSLSGGENPDARREDLRLACARPDIPEAEWDTALDKFKLRLHYFYFDEAKYQFRKEPNVISLQHTYLTNLQGTEEVDAYIRKTVEDKALGANSPEASSVQVTFQPKESANVDDDDELKLIVLDFRHVVSEEAPTELTREVALDFLSNRGQVLRQRRNTLIFCVADSKGAGVARSMVGDYLSWRKIQANQNDWDRIGGAQQAIVKGQLEDTEGGAHKALISAYSWALVPVEDRESGSLDLQAVKLGAYSPGKLIAPMVWEKLTSQSGLSQPVLLSLTPDALLKRYGPQAWPEVESWITTAQLWDRFTHQVALPQLARQQVLLETLQLGQREGLFAIGHLNDASSPRDQRDSYLSLFFEESVLPPNVPGMGERWLLLRPAMYQQIANQPALVRPSEITNAIQELAVEGQPLKVSAVHNMVKAKKGDNMDDDSFHAVLPQAVKEIRATFRAEPTGEGLSTLPGEAEEVMNGFLVVGTSPPQPKPSAGRTISVKGKLRSVAELGPLYKKVLQLLSSQNPKEFRIFIDVSATFERDPGAGFDASLEEGFDETEFPGLTLEDSKDTPDLY